MSFFYFEEQGIVEDIWFDFVSSTFCQLSNQFMKTLVLYIMTLDEKDHRTDKLFSLFSFYFIA